MEYDIRTFPTIPSLYLEVINALKDPNASTDKIGAIISKDMAMTTKLVQVINSSYFGLPRTITDPTEAVGILGFETVKSLIMTVKLLSQHDKVKPVYFSIDNIWKHSTNVAHTAKALARLETGDAQTRGHAYTAGLMHDMGKVILAANFDEQYHKAHVVARKEQRPLWEVEKDILGASHGEIGAYLLGLWGMSAEVVKVAAMHHYPLRAGDTEFTALTAVHVANALEYEGDANLDGMSVAVIDTVYLQQLGLEERIDSWRRARRDPEETRFETRAQRAKSAAAKSMAKPLNTAPAPAPENQLDSNSDAPTAKNLNPAPTSAPASGHPPAPKMAKFAPSAWKRAPSPWGSLTRWLGFGLGVSAMLALLARMEVMRLEKLSEKPEIQIAVENGPRQPNMNWLTWHCPTRRLNLSSPSQRPLRLPLLGLR